MVTGCGAICASKTIKDQEFQWYVLPEIQLKVKYERVPPGYPWNCEAYDTSAYLCKSCAIKNGLVW